MANQDFVEFPHDPHTAAIILMHLCKKFVTDYAAEIEKLGHVDNPYDIIFLSLHSYDLEDFAHFEVPSVAFSKDLERIGKAFITRVKKTMHVPETQKLEKHQAQVCYNVIKTLASIPEDELSITDEEFWSLYQKHNS